MTSQRPEAITILLVEDNYGDQVLVRKALEKGGITNEIHVVEDGEEALAFLRREGPYENGRRPDLVLLDLNLPRLDGREVLAEIKLDPDLRRIPVVVLTSSSEDRDVLNSYDLHANAYVPKPIELNAFVEAVRSIEKFWLAFVKLPPE